jgi:hypothetical protein
MWEAAHWEKQYIHVGAPAPIKWQLNDENDDQQWI